MNLDQLQRVGSDFKQIVADTKVLAREDRIADILDAGLKLRQRVIFMAVPLATQCFKL